KVKQQPRSLSAALFPYARTIRNRRIIRTREMLKTSVDNSVGVVSHFGVKTGRMSMEEARCVMALEREVAELMARVSALEARPMAENPVPQTPCPRCEQQRQRAQARLHKH